VGFHIISHVSMTSPFVRWLGCNNYHGNFKLQNVTEYNLFSLSPYEYYRRKNSAQIHTQIAEARGFNERA
jgi:hypothetical protein